MKFVRIFFYLLLISPQFVSSQTVSIKKISGLPTKDIYDLLIDSKGFLWIAHDLGVSRYDGINFTSYASNEQTSLSATDLLEDKQGRIWFHNFTGQIFYIENEKVHLLAAYDYKTETTFPRMVLLNNELITSTDKGLFVCNTLNLSCHYIKCANSAWKGTTSLTVINKTVIAYGNNTWFMYKPGGSLKSVTLYGAAPDFVKNNASTLTAAALKDTAFLISNPAGILSELTIAHDSLKLSKKIYAGDFINTVTLSGNDVWVNTIRKSFLLNNLKEVLSGYNLTDIVTDQEGNTWYSSLKNGLVVKYKTLDDDLLPLHIAGKDDIIKCFAMQGDTLISGTQNGYIVLYDTRHRKILKQIKLPGNTEMIGYLYNAGAGNYLVATAINTYEVNIKTNAIYLLPGIKSLKQADSTSQFILMASANGLMIIPSKNYALLKRSDAIRFNGINFQQWKNSGYFKYNMRCRAVCYNPEIKTMFVAFKNGLYVVNKKGIIPFLYNGSYVNATCLKYINGKVFIATINKGLLIIDSLLHTTQISVNEGLSSNIILALKKTGNRMWIIGDGSIRVLDLQKLKLISDLNLSSIASMQVLDVDELDNKSYIATNDGAYLLKENRNIEKLSIKNYLQTILVNDKPLDSSNNNFPYFENNIRFNLAVPFYYHANDIYFKYLLEGSNNQSWQLTKPGERSITFSELAPGKYKFKAVAIHPQLGKAVNAIFYQFTIADRWWQTWWFKLLAVLFISALLTYILASYFLNRLRIQKTFHELQLNLNNERQRISSEIHDDVGAAISAINLLVNIAESNDAKVIDNKHIKGMLSDISTKINEIIWSTNTENDTLESLIYYIEAQAYKLFEHTQLKFKAIVPTTILYHMISGEKRRNIYLVIIEFLNNALKHAAATYICLDMSVEKNQLLIIISDNGVGYDHLNISSKGMGLKTTKARMMQVKGLMEINSDSKGTLISLKIPLRNL